MSDDIIDQKLLKPTKRPMFFKVESHVNREMPGFTTKYCFPSLKIDYKVAMETLFVSRHPNKSWTGMTFWLTHISLAC